MSTDSADFFAGLAKSLRGAIARSRENLLPAAFEFLWEPARFTVAFGGRASGKSWSIARALLVLAYEAPLRVLCCREIQASIKESSYRLLADQIELLGLSDFFDVGADAIIGGNGSRFAFEGLRYNSSRIRSYEGIDVVWVEEAQSVSELNWEVLLPTIRKPGSRFFISFNPMTPDDPVACRFVANAPPRTIARKVSFRDNPFLSPESEAERQWLEQTDPDSYRHVWEGEPRTVSDALILKNKYSAETFDVDPRWAGPYHGLDFGFSRDPSAAVRCYIDDTSRTLYIAAEFWQLGCDIDALPSALENAIPGISSHTVYCDSSRPETVSFLARHGIANARSAEKWPGSVDDGVAYLRSFSRIVIDPTCTHVLDEAGTYSFKTDRLTGVPLPEVEDKHNHCLDAVRYALWPLIKNLPIGGYFSRAALLVGGEPAAMPIDKPEKIFGVLATTDRPGSSVGVVIFAGSPHYGWPLLILDYLLAEIDDVLTEGWLSSVFDRLRALQIETHARQMCELWVEADALGDAVEGIALQHAIEHGMRGPLLNVCRIPANTLAPTLDLRAAEVKSTVNGGKLVKLSRRAYAQQITHRSSTTNHLTSQLFGYRPDARDAAQELVNAFVIGVKLVTT